MRSSDPASSGGRSHGKINGPTSSTLAAGFSDFAPWLTRCVSFDLRLAALSAAAGAEYTRYADDLLFSGDESFARSVGRFKVQVAAIAIEEGFAIQHRKTPS